MALPLAGKRILITRAKAQSSQLQQKLEAAGATVIAIPAIEIIPPDSYDPLDSSLRNIADYHWLVFTSANAVRAMAERMLRIAIPVDALASVSIAAIGNATADSLRTLGLVVSLLPPQAVAESLAASLAPHVAGKRVLLIRAKVARDILPLTLARAGAHVTIVEAYQTIVPKQSADALRVACAQGIDAITFTSASSVNNLIALSLEAATTISAQARKISIGPITTMALLEHGWRTDAQATTADLDSLVEACIAALADPEPKQPSIVISIEAGRS